MNPAEWFTPSAAVTEYGIPIETLGLYIQGGQFRTSVVVGQVVIYRAEVAALAMKMRAGLAMGDEL